MTDTPHITLVVSVFGDPDRQRDLHAILAIVPGGRPLPGTGGRMIEPGRAAAGYFGFQPAPVWCVAPVLRGEDDPAGLIGAAIRDGLRLAGEQGFRKAGIVIGGKEPLILSWQEVTAIVASAVQGHVAEGCPLEEIRLIASDSAVLSHVKACLATPGSCPPPLRPPH